MFSSSSTQSKVPLFDLNNFAIFFRGNRKKSAKMILRATRVSVHIRTVFMIMSWQIYSRIQLCINYFWTVFSAFFRSSFNYFDTFLQQQKITKSRLEKMPDLLAAGANNSFSRREKTKENKYRWMTFVHFVSFQLFPPPLEMFRNFSPKIHFLFIRFYVIELFTKAFHAHDSLPTKAAPRNNQTIIIN